MISVLIRVEHGAEALAITLGALIPAVADGLVADAVVLVSRPDDAIATIVEAVGATMSVAPEPGWRQGAALAKRDWLLCLSDGDVPSEGWIRVVERFVALSPPDRRFGRLERRRRGMFEGFRHRLRGLAGAGQVRAGDLVQRSALAEKARLGRPARIGARIERDPVFD
jgi:hypothetical protein